MSINIKKFLLCPVPEDQKPINEYIQIRENRFFSWVIGSNQKYFQNVLFLELFFFCCFLVFFNFDFQNSSFQTFLIAFKNSFHFLLIYLFLIFIKWVELNKRFQNSRLVYEEGSWYDSEVWEKPFFLIKNDKLISIQKIEPFIKRLFDTLLFLLFVNFNFVIFF